MPVRRRPLLVILFTIFLDLLGIGILVPVIPQLLGNPDSPQFLLPDSASTQSGLVLLGLLVASYPIAQFFAAPILGQLSDRFGRRPVLVISLAGTAVGYALFAIGVITRNLPILFASRILDGITGGNISVAQAALADVTTDENRAKTFGLMGAAFGLGFVIGPYMGGLLADPTVVSWFNASTPFWFATILSVLNMLSIIFLYSETNQLRSNVALRWDQSIQHIVKALSKGKLRLLFVVGFLFQGGFSFFTTLFGVYLIDRFGFSESQIGNVFAYIGIWIVITQALITPVIAKKWKSRVVLPLAMIANGFITLLHALPGPWQILLFIVPLFAIGNGITQANFMALLSRSAGREVQGEILGINASVAALSQALPPVLSGYIAARFAPQSTVYLSAAIVVFAGLVLFIGLRKSDLGREEGGQSGPVMAGH